MRLDSKKKLLADISSFVVCEAPNIDTETSATLYMHILRAIFRAYK
ncbi:MAG: hypothetical protein ACI9T7_001383 [Oleiphilaceae bacterium]|jgi:hypothetical protein